MRQTPLLERDEHLAALAAALDDAATGNGRVVLVSGEAGGGKTSLVRAFGEAQDAAVRVLWGSCDDLGNPRPLGPVREILPTLRTHPSWLGGMAEVYSTMLAELDRHRPTVVVIDDAQWADDASLDVVRFIGRRIGNLHALLVLTCRTEEMEADHPLRVTLGMIPPAVVHRLSLPALSIDAVSRLAGRADVTRLYELTGGNPFLVQEVLAAPQAEVPATVQDAVMARFTRLPAAARRSVELVAAVPGPAEQWLLDECGAASGAEEALRAGVLRTEGHALEFRHELVRRAVRRSMPSSRWREVNRSVLNVLAAADTDPALLAHLAVEAGDAKAIAEHAPRSARRAKDLGAYSEALDHYRRALSHARAVQTVDLVDVLEGYAETAGLVGRWADARRAAARAILLCREISDRVRLGRALCTLADIEWATGNGRAANEAIVDAVSVLETEPAGHAHVRAYSLRAKFALVDLRWEDAAAWADRAMTTADRGGLPAPGHAMVTMGACRLHADPAQTEDLLAALQAALRAGDLECAARAYVNLAGILLRHMEYEQARRFIDEGVQFLEAHDLFGALDLMIGVRACWHLDRGFWADAERAVLACSGNEEAGVMMARLAVVLVQARRGDGAAADTIEMVSEFARRNGDARIVVPAALAGAELAWLSGDPTGAASAVESVIDRLRRSAVPRWLGEASLWLHRAGEPNAELDGAALPYALQVAGRWREAAAIFTRLGRPYEAADALGDADDPEALREALESLHRLGAAPRAAMVRRRLAATGVSRIPRGPRASTRSNPAGLTQRQVEVLTLMATELTYRQMAEKLHVSPKTVDHHASAIRSKLRVNTRDEAVAAGRALGITGDSAEGVSTGCDPVAPGGDPAD